MFASVGKAAGVIFDRACLGVVLKALALTLVLFLLLFVGAQYGIRHLPATHSPVFGLMLNWLGALLVILLVFWLGAPVAALFAALFLDDIAASVERRFYPGIMPLGNRISWAAVFMGLRLFGWTVAFGVLLLPANLFLPGIGTILSLGVNGWLLGREYFELAGIRHAPLSAVDSIRRRHSAAITCGGSLIAFLAAIPLANLFAPLFGVALMVHEFRRYAEEEGSHAIA